MTETKRDDIKRSLMAARRLRAITEARSEFIGIEHLTDEQIGQIRTALEAEAGVCEGEKAELVEDSVDQLLKRR